MDIRPFHINLSSQIDNVKYIYQLNIPLELLNTKTVSDKKTNKTGKG